VTGPVRREKGATRASNFRRGKKEKKREKRSRPARRQKKRVLTEEKNSHIEAALSRKSLEIGAKKRPLGGKLLT